MDKIKGLISTSLTIDEYRKFKKHLNKSVVPNFFGSSLKAAKLDNFAAQVVGFSNGNAIHAALRGVNKYENADLDKCFTALSTLVEEHCPAPFYYSEPVFAPYGVELFLPYLDIRFDDGGYIQQHAKVVFVYEGVRKFLLEGTVPKVEYGQQVNTLFKPLKHSFRNLQSSDNDMLLIDYFHSVLTSTDSEAEVSRIRKKRSQKGKIRLSRQTNVTEPYRKPELISVNRYSFEKQNWVQDPLLTISDLGNSLEKMAANILIKQLARLHQLL